MLKKSLFILLCAALAAPGCASASGGRIPAAPVVEPSALSDYVQRIPAGSRVRVEDTSGNVMRGTLMKVTPQAVCIQKNTRLPEPPVELPVTTIARLTLDNNGGSSTAKAVAIGVATGVGAFFGMLAIFAAAWND